MEVAQWLVVAQLEETVVVHLVGWQSACSVVGMSTAVASILVVFSVPCNKIIDSYYSFYCSIGNGQQPRSCWVSYPNHTVSEQALQRYITKCTFLSPLIDK